MTAQTCLQMSLFKDDETLELRRRLTASEESQDKIRKKFFAYQNSMECRIQLQEESIKEMEIRIRLMEEAINRKEDG